MSDLETTSIEEIAEIIKKRNSDFGIPIRIFLSGPSSSGKTTLAKELSKILGIEHVGSSPRRVLQRQNDKGELEFTTQDAYGVGSKAREYQMQCQKHFLVEMGYRYKTGASFVSERHGVDFLAYEEVLVQTPIRFLSSGLDLAHVLDGYDNKDRKAINLVFTLGPNDEFLKKTRKEEPENVFVKKDIVQGFVKAASRIHKERQNIVFMLTGSLEERVFKVLQAALVFGVIQENDVVDNLRLAWKSTNQYYNIDNYFVDGLFFDYCPETYCFNKPIPGLLSDVEIKSIFSTKITPFHDGTRKKGEISSGVSSGGYDFRLGRTFKVVKPNFLTSDVEDNIIDPLDPPEEMAKHFENLPVRVDKKGREYVVLEPHQCALAETLEHIQIPDDILIVLLGKSTYARCFVLLNTTPLEPGWSGVTTLEITNISSRRVKLYVGQGIAQGLFFRMTTSAGKPYEGVYQNQKGLAFASVRR